MLEEICRRRAMLGRCVFIWTSSHRGNSANSVADACAKAYLEQPEWAGTAGAEQIAAAVRTRPCVYGVRTDSGRLSLRDRRVYREADAGDPCTQLRKRMYPSKKPVQAGPHL